MKPRFLLFKASAGSGKTFNLAVQYLALLVAKQGDEYRRILAVTFTNKATAEMKQRIVGQLYAVGNALPKHEEFLARVQEELRTHYRLTLSDDEVRQRCRTALHGLLHDYDHFCVSTIDTFFQTVLRNMAHELGLNARLQIDLNAPQLCAAAVDNLIDSLTPGDKKMIDWLMDYAGERMDEGKRWDMRGELKTLANLLFQEVYLKRANDTANKPFDTTHINDFRKKLRLALDARTAEARQAAAGFETHMEAWGYSYKDLHNGSKSLKPFIERTASGDTTKPPTDTVQNMAGDWMAMVSPKKQEDEAAREAAQRLHPLLLRVTEAYRQIATLQEVRRTLTPMALLGAIEAEVQRINHNKNSFVLAHTPILLDQMMQDGDSPFIFEKIGTRYHHMMIDEFQDTSRLQWSNFGCLLSETLAHNGLSMVVGDVKQSIYRWRNGDWHTLYQLAQHGIPGTTLDLRPLQDNYRSQKGIIDFNNTFFPEAAKKLDALGQGCDGSSIGSIYADVRQGISKKKMEGGYVRIHLTEEEGKATEQDETTDTNERSDDKQTKTPAVLQELCETVRTLNETKGVPYGEMAILVRTKTPIPDIIQAFSTLLPDVQVISDEAFRLGYSSTVNIIVTALQVINEHQQPVPSPLPQRYLEKLYQQHVLQKPFTPTAYCDTDAPLLPAAFTSQTDTWSQVPLYELCEELYRTLRLDTIKHQDSYVLTFFDELTRYLRDNPSDLPSFLSYWDESMQKVAIPIGKVDGIRIVTVHSSKGLEYHTVLIPYCDWLLEDDKPQYADSLLWCAPQSKDTEGIGLLPLRLCKELAQTEFAPLYREEHYHQRTDEFNALYVAFTRPEHNLFVWGKLSKQTTEEAKAGKAPLHRVSDLLRLSLASFDEQGVYEEGNLLDYKQEDAKEPNRISPRYEPQDATMQSYQGNFDFRQSRPAAEFVRSDESEQPELSDKQLTYIEKGKLLHYIFSKIHQASDIDRVADEMMQRGVLAGEKQRKEVLSLARRGLRNPVVATWFDGDYQLFNESGIIFHDTQEGADSKQANHIAKRRPDRVMLRNDRVVVVDYKFGSPAPEHADQVREYMHLLQQMLPNNPVEGHLWYVYRDETKEVTL